MENKMQGILAQIEETNIQNNEEYYEKYDIQIDELDYGYRVKVGCKGFAIESKETLLNMITKYINNPAEVQKEFFNKTLIIK
jgi:hypothetical protein